LGFFYFSGLPVPLTYAQAITSPTVRIAPANPDSIQSRPIVGKCTITHGMKSAYVALAMMPAMKPTIANIPKIFNLSSIIFHLGSSIIFSDHFRLTYIFLSIIANPPSFSFIREFKAKIISRWCYIATYIGMCFNHINNVIIRF